MKTITIDYDLYKKELKEAELKGVSQREVIIKFINNVLLCTDQTSVITKDFVYSLRYDAYNLLEKLKET